jgi:hypothetical protein
MRLHRKVLPCVVLLAALGLPACEDEKAGGGSKTSAYGGTESHDAGQACMGCHAGGSDNEFWWTVAGTVYKPDGISTNPGCTVLLTSGASPDSGVVATLPVDARGNFYTTVPAAFGNGLRAWVRGTSGVVRGMGSTVSQGNCNDCHVAGQRITVD